MKVFVSCSPYYNIIIPQPTSQYANLAILPGLCYGRPRFPLPFHAPMSAEVNANTCCQILCFLLRRGEDHERIQFFSCMVGRVNQSGHLQHSLHCAVVVYSSSLPWQQEITLRADKLPFKDGDFFF